MQDRSGSGAAMRYPIVKVDQPGRSPIYLALIEPIEIGRECEGLVVQDEKVSRRHVRLTPRGHAVSVTDLGSTNGSFLDEDRVVGDATMLLGSILKIGSTAITVDATLAAATTMSSDERQPSGTIVATLERTREAESASSVDEAASSGPPPVDAGGQVGTTSIDRVVASLGGAVSLPLGTSDETITIMFSDIESSTEFAVRVGDARWYEVLSRHNSLFEERVRAHRGYIVKTQGDGYMVTFNSARRAIICACEIQQALHHQATQDPSVAVSVRIGMHTGEPIRQDSGDILGRHVIVAARIGGIAEGGEVLVSSIVRELASARGDLDFDDGRVVHLKGLGEQMVFPVRWGTDSPKI